MATVKWYFAEYDAFWIESEAHNYTLRLSEFVGNGGNSFGDTSYGNIMYHEGMAFTTPDVDNDLWSTGSCALLSNSGWWFNSCWWICLTCVYSSPNFSWY